MGEPTVEALYEQVRTTVPTAPGEVPDTLLPVGTGIRVLALRTPTLPPAAHTNSYVVGPDHGPQALIDPGSPYPDQHEVLDRVLAEEAGAGRPLAMVLLTHHHGDHIGDAARVAQKWGVPIAAHAKTAARLRGRVAVTRELVDGEQLDEFGITCVYTPGHADGHLCFEHGDTSAVGDMVAGLGWILIDPVEGDMAEYLGSLRLLIERPAKTLLPAHGPVIVDGEAKLREYIAHRTMREDRVVAALQGARTLDELVPEVYADTPKLLWPLAERSLRAHLDKLVRELRAVEVEPGRWTRR